MIRHSTKLIAPFLVLCFFQVVAQPGIKDSIYSQSIKEERRLQIQLPKEYKPGSGEKYQVLYLLDGEWNAELFQQVQAWSQQWGYTPPIIMVGVVNSYPNNQNQRFRDLTPTATGPDGSGGGPALLSFLKNELIPYINKKYPSNGSNILWGHSLGGLFVLYTLFTEPQLFDSYIAADPAVWWDHGFLLRYAQQKMNSITQIKSLFITGRTGTALHGMGIDSLEMVLKDKAPALLQWKLVAYTDETHVSQQYKSAYDGLKYTVAPQFQQDAIHIDPMEGIVEKGKPFRLSCYNILPDKYMRFTTDGSVPTLSSPAFQAENTITPSSSGIIIKSFFANDTLNKTVTPLFKIKPALTAQQKPANALSGGWSYTCYSDSGMKHIIKSGITDEHLNLNQLNDTSNFYCRISGFLQTEKEGYYSFQVVGGPGTKLYLNNQLLVETGNYKSFIVPLKKGFYPIQYEYSHHNGGPDFEFYYLIPGQPENGAIPFSLMYH